MTLDRRQFLISAAVLGGGLSVSLAAGAGDDVEITPWIVIAPDDIVTIRVASPESGNGVMTQEALIIAEELQCDWAKVRIEPASANRDFREWGTYSPLPAAAAFFGGRSTASFRMRPLLQVGASARERLKAAAAALWNISAEEIDAKDSVLTHRASGRRLRYGEVAAKAAAVKLAVEPKPKPPGEWTLLGKSMPKHNLDRIVDGSAVFGMDVRLPGMVYAALLQSPVHGGRLQSVDADAVLKRPGVLAVVTVDPDEPRGLSVVSGAAFGYASTAPRAAVAVIAEHYWQARKALEALPVTWSDHAKWRSSKEIEAAAFAALSDDRDARVERSTGSIEAIEHDDKVVAADYLTPFCDHACMEPLNGTALVTADRVEIWHPAQHAQQAFWVAADEAGMLPERVTFHPTLAGGGFGRRLEADDVRMVVAVAKRFPGRPVHVVWSREEMMRQGRYRPLVAARLRATLGADGLPQAISVKQATKGHYPRFADTAFLLGGIPNVRVDGRELPIHVATGPYRGPGYNSYAFMLETFIDECAVAAGADPVDYRLRLLANWPNPGWAKALKEVAARADWGKALPRGMGQGVAIAGWGLNGMPMAGTVVCVIALVEVTKDGRLHVHKLDASFDCGRVINPDAAVNLVEGGLIFGLNMALNEEITIADGKVVQSNFDDYPILRTGDIPRINVHLGGLSGADRYSELGEPPLGPVGPAVGNAIYRAIGKRVRTQPFRNQDLSWI